MSKKIILTTIIMVSLVANTTFAAPTIDLSGLTDSNTESTQTVGNTKSYQDSVKSYDDSFQTNTNWQNGNQWQDNGTNWQDSQVQLTDSEKAKINSSAGQSGPSSYSDNDSTIGTKSNQTTSVTSQNVGTCIGGQLLARLLASSITSGIKSMTQTLGIGALETTTKVPVTLVGTQVATNIEAETNARSGSFLPGTGTQTSVSWDGIAYCIVNTIIDYIINSTIQWANSGFKGNPAFIRNPEQFFQNIANREASMFIQELAYNTTQINVCAPFRVQLAVGLKGAYNGSLSGMRNYGSCSLTQMQQNMMQSGQYTITTPTDWIALTRPENNLYYSYITAGDELSNRINIKKNTATLDLTINKGFLSYKKCKDDSKPESKTNTCEVKTPGVMIADGLSKTLGMSKDRLVNAQRFDQMVDAIVNNLIKIAISKTMEEVTGKAASQAVVSDYYTAVSTGYGGYNNTNYNNYVDNGISGVVKSNGGTMLQQILGGVRFKNEEWNSYALQQIQNSGILSIPVSDVSVFFPGGTPTAEGYLSIMAAIAEKESGGKAKPARYLETQIAGTPYSVGLLSLSESDAEARAGGYSYDDLENPFINIKVGVQIMKRLVSKRGIIHGNRDGSNSNGIQNAGLPEYWSTFRW